MSDAFEQWAADKTFVLKASAGDGYVNVKEMAREVWQAALQSAEPVVDDRKLAKRVAKRRRQFEALCAQVRDPQAGKGGGE
jgi:hypothetical protein